MIWYVKSTATRNCRFSSMPEIRHHKYLYYFINEDACRKWQIIHVFEMNYLKHKATNAVLSPKFIVKTSHERGKTSHKIVKSNLLIYGKSGINSCEVPHLIKTPTMYWSRWNFEKWPILWLRCALRNHNNSLQDNINYTCVYGLNEYNYMKIYSYINKIICINLFIIASHLKNTNFV